MLFNLPGLSATKIVSWFFHVDDSSKGKYDMNLCIDLLTLLVLNLKLSEQAIKEYDETLKGSTSSMFGLGTCGFKILNIGKIKPKESFINAYAEEMNEF